MKRTSAIGRIGERLLVSTWDSHEPKARTKLGVEVTQKLGARRGQFLNYVQDGGRVTVSVSDTRDRTALWSAKVGPDSRSRLSEVHLRLLGGKVYDTLVFTFLGRGRATVEVIKGGETEDAPPEEFFLPDELEEGPTYLEGAMKRVTLNAYERDPRARRACLRHYGTDCFVCGFSFEKCYGDIGAGYIHVHHLKPLAQAGGEYELDPVEDLRPVCPNCHAMLHKLPPPHSIEELRDILARSRGASTHHPNTDPHDEHT